MMRIRCHCCVSKYTCRQILLFSIGLTHSFVNGAVLAFGTVLFYQLDNDGPQQQIKLDMNQKEIIETIPVLVMIPSAFFSGFITEHLGRRLMLFLLNVIAFISWATLFFGLNYEALLSARILIGIYIGGFFPTYLTFLGEVSTPKHRTVLLTAIYLGTTDGYYTCQYLGDYFHWKIVASCFAVFSLYNIAVLLHFKDSFVTFLHRDYNETARELFHWFRGYDEESRIEFDVILQNQKRQFTNKAFIKPLCITIVIFLTHQVTNTFRIDFFYLEIITMMSDNEDVIDRLLIVFIILSNIVIIIGLVIIANVSVKRMILTTGYMNGIILIATGVAKYICTLYHIESLGFIFLILILINSVVYSVGLGLLTSVVCGEMFPQATRSIGISISASFMFLLIFIFNECVPIVFKNYESQWIIISSGVLTLIGIIITHYIMPNTKNMTLQEINDLFHK